jgi:CubicO group peptidase (beta-lactamase class C family)
MRRSLPRSLSAALLALPSVVAAQALPGKAEVAHRVDSLAAAFVSSNGAPAVSIAVVRNGETLASGGWGFADVENEVHATERTVYRVGSITKQFTSAAVMQLVEQGKVNLDEPMGTYLPNLPEAWRGALVRQYLNHTAGVPSYTNIGMRWRSRWGEEMVPETLVALTAKDSMWFKPGTNWAYDNSGYVVLGMLVEKVTGRHWSDDLVERFAKPLGLTDTRNCMTRPVIARRAQGYEPGGNPWTNAEFLAMSQPFSAGAICSTVVDIAKWNAALHGGKVVSAGSYRLMTTPEGAAVKSHYGFGLTADTTVGHRSIKHNGGINGFSATNAWFPDDRLSVTVLTNSGRSLPDQLLVNATRVALGIAIPVPPKRVALSGAALAKYSGAYAMNIGGVPRDFTFTVRGDTLIGHLRGQQVFPLIAFENHTFGVEADPELRIIFTMQGDRAASVRVLQNGNRWDGARKD